MILSIFFMSLVHAKEICVNDCEGDVQTPARVIQTTESKKQESVVVETKKTDKVIKLKQKRNDEVRAPSSRLYQNQEESNLPPYLSDIGSNGAHEFVFQAKTEANDNIPGLNRGSKIKVVIRQSIKASPSIPTPVVAEIISSSLKGSYVYGEATLENDLKRVVFKFSSLAGGGLDNHYSIKGSGLDVHGRVGQEGDYHSEDWKYGIFSFLSTSAAIAVDSQVERSQTITGNYAESPSASNALKKGVAGSMGKVAERMAERAANVPGFTEIEGPIYLTLVLDEKPKSTR